MDKLRTSNTIVREFLAEFLGTFVLTTIGCCVNAFIVVAKDGPIAHSIAPWGWGMALTAAIYVCGGVSGGHVNPAVTLGLASVGKFAWYKIPHYFVAQYLGAFLASAVTYFVYIEKLDQEFGLSNETYSLKTAGIFGTLPNASTGTCFVDQTVATAFFLLIINAITDEKNMSCLKGLIPIAIGMTDLGLMIFAFGYNCGAPINPARDLAPRIFTAIAGWGDQVFSVYNFNYFWVPIVACHLGGIIGCWIYKLFIELHWPDSFDPENRNKKIENGGTPSF